MARIRIPYTAPLVIHSIIPNSAKTLPGAVAALQEFLTSPTPGGLGDSTVVLSGAGLSVASGLADYRGTQGTYRLNKTYRPIYYHEFVALNGHEARKRYWARSFLGWTNLHKAKPNAGHYAVRDLAQYAKVRKVITQNVDSFHPQAHPQLPTVELHGYLRALVCTSCHQELHREVFQTELARLNPAWAVFLAEVIASGALDTEDPVERKAKGIRTNPDGDVDLPDAPYTTFRYPTCPHCLSNPPLGPDGSRHKVEIDQEGAWKPGSTAGILKPAVVMFGENIPTATKMAAEEAIDEAGRLLVLATSLATYSAWRLAKRAQDRGMPLAVVNMLGVRGEDILFAGSDPNQSGSRGARIDLSTQEVLPALVEALRQSSPADFVQTVQGGLENEGAGVFKDMLS